MSLTKLQEISDSRGRTLAVDRENGVIRGVKILGRESRNNRTYSEAAMASAVGLYEGSRVYVNHAKGSAGRDYRDRFGVLKSVRKEGDGLYADHHFPKQHALAEQYCHDAENSPHNVGFSHVAEGRVTRSGAKLIVEEIKSVASVDLVDDPATTRGLFESKDSDMELQEQVDKLKADVLELTGKLEASNAAAAKLTEENAAYKAAADKAEAKQRVTRLLAESKVEQAKVPAGILSLLESMPESDAKKTIEELAESLRGKVKSAPGDANDADKNRSVDTAEGFAALLKRK